jgi:hypothetical protein
VRDEEGFFEVAALFALCGTSRLSLPGLSLPGQVAGGKLIAFSVHRWQAHLLDKGAIARVGMEKVESGVRLSQQQQ